MALSDHLVHTVTPRAWRERRRTYKSQHKPRRLCAGARTNNRSFHWHQKNKLQQRYRTHDTARKWHSQYTNRDPSRHQRTSPGWRASPQHMQCLSHCSYGLQRTPRARLSRAKGHRIGGNGCKDHESGNCGAVILFWTPFDDAAYASTPECTRRFIWKSLDSVKTTC